MEFRRFSASQVGQKAERQISLKVHGFLGGILKVFSSLVSVYLDGILKVFGFPVSVCLEGILKVSASWAAFRRFRTFSRSRTPKCGALIWPNLQENHLQFVETNGNYGI
ncbi:unnamed protein product [Rhizophagus irregularis]|nr:unnamed protein product [Rhizophagus irregularis]